MPYGISRLTALVVPLALLMPLTAASGQEPVSPIPQRQIVEVNEQFLIRTAERRAPITASARPTMKLGSSIHLDRGLLAPTPLLSVKSRRTNSSQTNIPQGGTNETR